VGEEAEEEEEDYAPIVEAIQGGGEIAWQKKEISSLKLLGDSYGDNSEGEYGPDYYEVGAITGGIYDGGRLIFVDAPPQGMGDGYDHFLFVEHEGKNILLQQHSDEPGDPYSDTKPTFDFEVDSQYRIASMVMPKTINGPEARQALKLDENSRGLFDTKDKVKVFTHSKLGDIYTDAHSESRAQNGFYARMPDGRRATYSLDIDFLESDVPQVTWSGGVKNTAGYNYSDFTGCGSSNYISTGIYYAEDDYAYVERSELGEIGKNSKGDTILGLTLANHPLLEGVYANAYFAEGENPTYEQFLSAHPVFFWEDPFGRLVKFQQNQFLPAVECGKPVIYLYPEKTTNVFVHVSPQGGFTFTEPEHGEGWSVSAAPNGLLIEDGSGDAYPYLFWEGRGGIYETPDRGFVVAKNEVHNFLVDKLTRLGLIEIERADFLKFWEPRMKDAPYYFVTFQGNAAMDRLAPLTVRPEPDTVIRILMDYMPLEKPIEVQGYDIHTPKRKGFTVVEWGGVLR
jgi:hypothetical protein